MRSDDEKRILGLWPKYEDGGYVMPGDVAVANNGAKKGRAFTVLSVRVNTVGVCLTDCDGSYWNYRRATAESSDRSLRCWTPMGWRSTWATRYTSPTARAGS